jgi:hypothetical protein
MTNTKLIADYQNRARGRRKAIQTLLNEKLYADVVRECQEAAELVLKSFIREAGHSIPFTHDVSCERPPLTEVRGFPSECNVLHRS